MRTSYQFILVFAGFVGCAISALSAESPQSCALIAQADARLACFDTHFPASDALSSLSQPEASAGDSLDALSSPVLERKREEGIVSEQWFALSPHRLNYVLPVTYNASSDYSLYGPFEDLFNDTEVKFQLSLKTRLADNLWRGSSLWVGYTQQSYWQLYANSDASAPFRETNHEPELFLDVPVNFDFLGWNARLATVGINHQSNGRAEPLSRSWNRLTGSLVFDRGPFVASVKSWIRLEEDEENDNNPDIEDYMGRMELGLAYKRGDHLLALGLKNNLSSDNRSGVELNWTFPLVQRLRGFVQVYSGYGENLIDAENYSNRIGVGISLGDWF